MPRMLYYCTMRSSEVSHISSGGGDTINLSLKMAILNTKLSQAVKRKAMYIVQPSPQQCTGIDRSIPML